MRGWDTSYLILRLRTLGPAEPWWGPMLTGLPNDQQAKPHPPRLRSHFPFTRWDIEMYEHSFGFQARHIPKLRMIPFQLRARHQFLLNFYPIFNWKHKSFGHPRLIFDWSNEQKTGKSLKISYFFDFFNPSLGLHPQLHGIGHFASRSAIEINSIQLKMHLKSLVIGLIIENH